MGRLENRTKKKRKKNQLILFQFNNEVKKKLNDVK